jgi:hypothetical protein
MPEPGDTNAIANCKSDIAITHGYYSSDNFVAGNERQFGLREITVDDVEVGAADRAGGDFDKHLAGAWARQLPLNQPKRLANSLEHHRLHVITSLT